MLVNGNCHVRFLSPNASHTPTSHAPDIGNPSIHLKERVDFIALRPGSHKMRVIGFSCCSSWSASPSWVGHNVLWPNIARNKLCLFAPLCQLDARSGVRREEWTPRSKYVKHSIKRPLMLRYLSAHQLHLEQAARTSL